MDFGLILPSYREGAVTESIDAAAETAARLGWHSVFTTDHLLVEPSARSQDYFNVFDAVVTVAHVAARESSLKVGISVVVVPMRNAVQLAKELATLDALSGGRLIAGVGGGWNETEFGHVGAARPFRAARRVPRRGGRDVAPAMARRQGAVPVGASIRTRRCGSGRCPRRA